jgi:hypothetical protein
LFYRGGEASKIRVHGADKLYTRRGKAASLYYSKNSVTALSNLITYILTIIFLYLIATAVTLHLNLINTVQNTRLLASVY